MQVLVKFGDYLAWFQTLASLGDTIHPTRHHAHQAQVFFDRQEHARAQYLDRYLARMTVAVFKHGKMNLRNRGTGYRLTIERNKDISHLLVERVLNGGNRYITVKRWHPILQSGQFIRNVQWQQVASG